MQTPLLSINMVSFNTCELTLAAVRSIAKSIKIMWEFGNSKEQIELIIVDNASKDQTVAKLNELTPTLNFSLKVIESPTNLGFGAGHNLAAKNSTGQLLLLINTDTVLLNNALNTFVGEFIKYNSKTQINEEKVHFLGPKLLNSDLSPQASCGHYYSLPVIFTALFLQGDKLNITRFSPNNIKKVDWVSGAAFITRREYFEELRGFDEDIFMYMEEIELFKRARDSGFNIYFTPNAQIVHIGSASSNKTFPIIQVFRGFLYLYKKHHKGLGLFMVQYLLLLKSHVAIFIGRLLKKPQLVTTYLQAKQQIYL